MVESNVYHLCPNNCGRKYKHKRSIYVHLKYECGVEPQFMCDVCGRKFSQRVTLRNHRVMVHKLVS